MRKSEIDRRKFLALSAQGSAALGLSAFPIVSHTGCSNVKARTVKGACYHDCPDRCSWQVTTENGKITQFSASKDNPYTAGTLCNKMVNFPDEVTYHPDRILNPLKRTGEKGSGSFEEISWEQAIAEVAERLQEILTDKGGEAVLPYSFGGNQGKVQSSFPNRFFAQIGASQLERTICGDTAVAGLLATNGQTTGVLPEDIVHSRYILLWGTNPASSNQHLWSLIQQARDKGAKLVAVDPFQSQTAQQADQHIQLMPGTDTVLALSMIHVILNEGLQDQDYIDQYTQGIEELSAHVQQYTPSEASAITGLEASDIKELARSYAQASPALIRVLIGMEHQANGGSAFRAIAMLPALTGAWRDLGGGLMNMTYELFGEALNWEPFNLPIEVSNPTTRKISMVKLGQALTDRSLEPSIDALFVYNSNPAVTTPNQNLVLQGLERDDLLTVVLEHFKTDTARYADYIFPATSVLENWDILTSWATPYLNLNEPAIAPLGQSKTNAEFFRLLAKSMGFTQPYLFEEDLDIVKASLQTDHPYLTGVTFESLRKSGWVKLQTPSDWRPHAAGNFKTASGKCNLYNPDMEEPLPVYHEVKYTGDELRAYPLHLLTVKSPKGFLNSSHANVSRLRQAEGVPVLDISAADAEARNISDGDEVRVFNVRGEVTLSAKIRQKVRKGVVCMPQGFWPSLMMGGSSANALTDDRLTDLGRGAAIQEARVEVAKV